jgi:hypothetical protein
MSEKRSYWRTLTTASGNVLETSKSNLSLPKKSLSVRVMEPVRLFAPELYSG